MIRVGLLAYGAIGDEHNQAVLTTPGLTTVAVCDQKAERITAALKISGPIGSFTYKMIAANRKSVFVRTLSRLIKKLT